AVPHAPSVAMRPHAIGTRMWDIPVSLIADRIRGRRGAASLLSLLPRDHFASGSGRNWILTTLLVVPRPRSIWNGVRVPVVVQRPFPFQPAFGSSIRPSIHFV